MNHLALSARAGIAASLLCFVALSPAHAASTACATANLGRCDIATDAYLDDTGKAVPVDSTHPLPVSGSVSVTTTGLATSAKQDTGNTSLGSIDTKLSSQATASNQSTGNTSLSSIDTKLSTVNTNLTSATPAGENVIGAVVGKADVAGCVVTRPADTTAYASGDLVANSVTAGSVTPCSITAARVNDGTGMIRRVRLTTSSTSLTNASFRVHFYRSCTITNANGDNAAWSTDGALNYIGAVDITLDKAFTDGAKGIGSPNAGSEINFTPVTGAKTLCALIEARGAYTPTSGETFTLAAELLQN